MSTLLVTGGAGFIGSNFIRFWLERHADDHVINLDALTYAGNLHSLKDVSSNANYSFVKGDVTDEKTVRELVDRVDIIVHFAAESHVDRSIAGPAAFVETNIRGTFVLLEAVRQVQLAGKHVPRFHHISTDEVFGTLSLESTELFSEGTQYAPRSPYAASKAAADHLVRAYHATYGIPVTITNCSNNFGPYQHPEKFIPRMITNVIDDQPVRMYGDGKYVRDWLYVRDHCRAIELALGGQAGSTYVVGGMEDEVDNLAVAHLVLTLMGKNEDQIQFVPDRPGHDRRYAVDWSKIKHELSWQPDHSFSEWLEKTIQWYRDNEWWWRPLKKDAEALYSRTGQ